METFMIPMVVKMILTKKFFAMSQMLLLKIHFVFYALQDLLRYTAYGFKIAEETLNLMSEIAGSGELDALTPERVWKEPLSIDGRSCRCVSKRSETVMLSKFYFLR